MSATGYIDSVYSGSGVDGKGLRCVVFFSGCNLRCPFCHNPETLYKQGKKTSSDELTQNLMRYKGYFRRGGVTVSGGEPFLQKEFFLVLARSLREKGIHVCAETNGHIADAELIAACDAILCPTAPTTAPKLGESLNDSMKMYLSDIFTVSVNLAGLPGLSVPCGKDGNGLPVGAQLIGAAGHDADVLNIGHAFQLATSFHKRKTR